jgi:hypothetical protein
MIKDVIIHDVSGEKDGQGRTNCINWTCRSLSKSALPETAQRKGLGGHRNSVWKLKCLQSGNSFGPIKILMRTDGSVGTSGSFGDDGNPLYIRNAIGTAGEVADRQGGLNGSTQHSAQTHIH